MYGHLEVICGPMYAGKTTSVLQQVIWHINGLNEKVLVLKPAFDTRYSKTELVNHRGLRAPAESISEFPWDKIDDTIKLIVIDECQFFESPHYKGDLPCEVRRLLARGHKIIAAGLDMDFRGIPFLTTSLLLGMADKVTKITSICTVSGGTAAKTYKKSGTGRVELGGVDLYEARSNAHWDPAGNPVR